MGSSIDRLLQEAADKKSKPKVDTQIDDLLNGMETERRLRAGASNPATPDSAQRVLRLEMQTGLPTDLIERNLDVVEKEASKKDFDAEKYRQQSPLVAKWLAENPHHVKAARPDLTRLSWLERQLRNIKGQFQQGRNTVEMSTLAGKAYNGTITPTEEKRLDALQAEAETLMSPDDYGLSTLGQIPGAIAQQIPLLPLMAVGAAQYGTKGLALGAAGGAMVGAGAGAAVGGVGAIPGAALGASAGAIALGAKGAGWGAAIAIGEMERNLAFMEYRKLKDESGKPLDIETAKGAALIVGVLNGAAEKLELNVLAKSIPGLRALSKEGIKKALMTKTARAAISRYVKNIALSVPTEAGVEFYQELTKDAAGTLQQLAQDGSLERMPMTEILGRIFSPEHMAAALESAKQGALAGGGISATAGSVGLALDVHRVNTARQHTEFFQALGKTMSESELQAKLPEKMRELVERLTKDGPIETVHAPLDTWNEYWQGQNLDPADVAEQITGSRTAYDEAASTGGDIAIPMARYATTIAATDHNTYFTNEIRLAPDALNGREGKKLKEKMAAEEKERAAEIAKIQPEIDLAATTFAEKFTVQLTDTKRYDATEIATHVKLLEDSFRALVSRGVPLAKATALFEKLNIQNAVFSKDELVPAKWVELNQGSMTPEEIEYLNTPQGQMELAKRLIGSSTRQEREAQIDKEMARAEARQTEAESRAAQIVNKVQAKSLDQAMNPYWQALHDLWEEAGPNGRLELLAKWSKMYKTHQEMTAGVNFTPEMANLSVMDLPDYVTQMIGIERVRQVIEMERVMREEQPPFEDEGDNAGFWQAAKRFIASKAFKKWFGKSKVTDEQGNPLVVYHRTPNRFQIFDTTRQSETGGQIEIGTHFGTIGQIQDIQHPGDPFGYDTRQMRRLPVLLKIENPLRLLDDKGTFNFADIVPDLIELGVITKKQGKAIQAIEREEYEDEDEDAEFGPRTRGAKQLQDLIKAKGYDGIVYLNRHEGLNGTGYPAVGKTDKEFLEMYPNAKDSYIVFDSNQVKSINNRGTFDSDNPNIYYQPSINYDFPEGDPRRHSPVALPPGFHSKAEELIEQRMPSKASARDVIGILKDVKAEERHWLGLDKMMEENPDEVLTKDFVLQQLQANRLNIEEVGLSPVDENVSEERRMEDMERIVDEAMRTDAQEYVRENWSFKADSEGLGSYYGTIEHMDIHSGEKPDWVQYVESPDYVEPVNVDWSLKGKVTALGGPYQEYRVGPFGSRLEAKAAITRMWIDFLRSQDDILDDYQRGAIEEQETGMGGFGEGNTQWRQYSVPGGTNYREIKFTLPNIPGKKFMQTTHWGRLENVFAFVQVTDRVTMDGKKLLHAEGIQSDWHEQGREKGYTEPGLDQQLFDAGSRVGTAMNALDQYRRKIVKKMGYDTYQQFIDAYYDDTTDVGISRQSWPKELSPISNPTIEKLENALDEAQVARDDIEEKMRKGLPDAPFKKTWHEFVLKRMLRIAAEEGYDGISWSTGTQVASHFSLSSVASRIDWNKEDTGDQKYVSLHVTQLNNHVTSHVLKFDELNDYIGKDLADKIRADYARGSNLGRFEGDALIAGGHGMRGFYDDIITRFLKSFTKKYGAAPDMTTIPIEGENIGVENRLRVEFGIPNINPGGSFGVVRYQGKWVLTIDEDAISPDELSLVYDVHGDDILDKQYNTKEEATIAGNRIFKTPMRVANPLGYVRTETGMFNTDNIREAYAPDADNPNIPAISPMPQMWTVDRLLTDVHQLLLTPELKTAALKDEFALYQHDPMQAWKMHAKAVMTFDTTAGRPDPAWILHLDKPFQDQPQLVKEALIDLDLTFTEKPSLASFEAMLGRIAGEPAYSLRTDEEQEQYEAFLEDLAGKGFGQFNAPDEEEMQRMWLAFKHPQLRTTQNMYGMYGQQIYEELRDQLGSEVRAKEALQRVGLQAVQMNDKHLFISKNTIPGEKTWRVTRIVMHEGRPIPVVHQAFDTYDEAEAFVHRLGGVKTNDVFQDKNGQPRGRIRFSTQGINIDLFKDADKSTLVHETGHFYMQMLQELAPENESIATDLQLLRDWVGAHGDLPLTRDQHEMVARGFEAYLFEGKAPVGDLHNAFSNFRAWLLRVYQSLLSLNVQLTDDVRGVFDRLLASEDAINAAQLELDAEPLFADPEAVGMDSKVAQDYASKVLEARVQAEDDLTQRILAGVKKEQSRQYKAARDKIRGEVAEEVNQDPVYRARALLTHGTMPDGSPLPEGIASFKLRRTALVATYGEGILKQLPRPHVYSATEGIHHDIAADRFGIDSGDSLVKLLIGSENPTARIERLTDERMKQENPDLQTSGKMPQAAMDAMHNEKRAQLLRAELQHLARTQLGTLKGLVRKITRPIPTIEGVRADAEEIIQSKTIRSIKPNVYRMAETKANKAALEALLKGDVELAFDEKTRELFNHELYRAASAAVTKVERVVDRMNRYGTSSTRERLTRAGGTYLAQIDAMLDRFDFKKVSNKALTQRQSLLEFVQDQASKGLPVDVPLNLLNEANRKHYKDLTLRELLDIDDTIKQINHQANVKNRLVSIRRQRTYQEAKADIVSTIYANHKTAKEPLDTSPSFSKRFKAGVKAIHAAHTKLEFLFEWLDLNKPQGTVWQYLFKPLSEAEDVETILMRDSVRELDRIFSAYSRDERALWFYKKIQVPELDASMNKASILAIALNWGNEGNREALLEGYGWTAEQVQKVLDKHMGERDWIVVQGLWDHLESYWPAVEKMERELNGLPPEKVEATPVVTQYGTLRGGYYPIVFDSKLNWRQAMLDRTQEVADLYGGRWSRAMTRHGHTEERTNSGGKPMLLELGGLTEHIANVVHDLAFRRAIIDVGRLTQDNEVRVAIESTVGRDMYRQIHPWLVNIAGDRKTGFTNPLEGLISKARTGATVVNLGWKLTTSLVQTLGYLNVINEVGPVYASVGLRDVFSKPWKLRNTWSFITARSEMMHARLSNYDRDVHDAGKRLNIAGTTSGVMSVADAYTHGLQTSWFTLIGWMDMASSMPGWMSGYRKAMDGKVQGIDKGDEVAAIDYADSIVRKTQGVGSAINLATVQRGNETFRLFTLFYSYGNALYNQFAKTQRQFTVDKNAPKLIASLALLWFLPAVMQELMLGRAPDSDADPDEWIRWLLRTEATYPFQSIVIVRDIVNGMGRYGYEPSAIFDVGAQIATLGSHVAGRLSGTVEELTRADLKAVVMLTGYAARLPSRQLWLTAEYLYDWMTDTNDPGNPAEFLWRTLVTGNPKED